MSIHAANIERKERQKEHDRERLVERTFQDLRLRDEHNYRLLVDSKRENGESIVATDFVMLNPLWKRMRKGKDQNGMYVRFGGRKCYEREWVRV